MGNENNCMIDGGKVKEHNNKFNNNISEFKEILQEKQNRNE